MKGKKTEGTGSLLNKEFGQYRSELVKKDVYSGAVAGGEACS